jgi:hypothetical protein
VRRCLAMLSKLALYPMLSRTPAVACVTAFAPCLRCKFPIARETSVSFRYALPTPAARLRGKLAVLAKAPLFDIFIWLAVFFICAGVSALGDIARTRRQNGSAHAHLTSESLRDNRPVGEEARDAQNAQAWIEAWTLRAGLTELRKLGRGTMPRKERSVPMRSLTNFLRTF